MKLTETQQHWKNNGKSKTKRKITNT